MTFESTFGFTDALKQLIEACRPGAKVLDLCELGDKILNEETSKVFKKDKEMKKGRLNYFNTSCFPVKNDEELPLHGAASPEWSLWGLRTIKGALPMGDALLNEPMAQVGAYSLTLKENDNIEIRSPFEAEVEV